MTKYKLTPEHKAQLKPWADRWIANAMSTKAMDDADRDAMRVAIKGLYEAANLTPPPESRIVFVPSPLVGNIAAGFAAGVWWLRRNNKTAAATDAATRDATDAATDAATRDATRAATGAATDAATRDATRAATGDEKNWFTGAAGAARSVMRVAGDGGLKCAYLAYRFYQGGSAWAWSAAYIAFGRDHAKLAEKGAIKQELYNKYEPWETLAKLSGFRFMHADFCIVSDRPLEYHIDDQNRPHCATGPFVRWADGSAFYAWHGVRTPAWIVERRNELTLDHIDAEQNAEVRRVMIELYGRERYMSDAGAKVIDHIGEDYPVVGLRDARLLRLARNGDDIVMIDLRDMALQHDGSRRRYLFRVNPALYGGDVAKSAHAAAASIHRRPENRAELYFRNWRDYAPAVET